MQSSLRDHRQYFTSLLLIFPPIITIRPYIFLCRFPSQLRSMCHCLYQVLSKRFPQVPHSNVSSVGTVIFLRFINPAIGEYSRVLEEKSNYYNSNNTLNSCTSSFTSRIGDFTRDRPPAYQKRAYVNVENTTEHC